MHKKYTPDILYVLDANGKEFHCGDLGYLKYPIFSSNGIFDNLTTISIFDKLYSASR